MPHQKLLLKSLKSHIVFLWLSVTITGCDYHPLSVDSDIPLFPQQQLLSFGRFAPVSVDSGERIAGATVTIRSLETGILAETQTADKDSFKNGDAHIDAAKVGVIEHVTINSQEMIGICDIRIEGGSLVQRQESNYVKVVNDTIQRALLPCSWLTDQGPPSNSTKIKFSRVSREIAHTLDVYTNLDKNSKSLLALLEKISSRLTKLNLPGASIERNTSYIELLSAPRDETDHIDIDDLYSSLRDIAIENPDYRHRPQPNIILILADDAGYGDVSAFWQYSDISTPNIDSIAANGATLTNFHVYPVCSATRAAILSGYFSRRHRLPGSSGPAKSGIPRSVELVPEYLRRAGYRTAAFGKWHLSSKDGFRPYQRGFQQWTGFYGWATPYNLAEISAKKSDYLYDGEGAIRPGKGHTTDLFVDRAIEFIEQDHSNPFFIYLSFNAPHSPLWNTVSKRYSGRGDWVERVKKQGIEPESKQDYVALIQHMDARIGDLLDTLEELNIAENTVVMFMSDNGAETISRLTGEESPGSNANFRGGKGSVYEGGIRVPMAIKWPNAIPSGKQFTEFTMAVDIWPTIREIANIPGAQESEGYSRDGDSLVPMLTGVGELTDDLVRPGIFNFAAREVAVILYPWKLIVIGDKSHLYNIERDPEERDNQGAEYPEKLLELTKILDDYLNES